MLGEDVEDQRDPVDNVSTEALLEIALLGRRELVVEDDEVDVEGVRGPAQLVGLAGPDVGRRVGTVPALQHGADRLRARGVGEAAQLFERILGLRRGVGADAGADEQRPLADDLEVDLGCGEAPPRSSSRPLMGATPGRRRHRRRG